MTVCAQNVTEGGCRVSRAAAVTVNEDREMPYFQMRPRTAPYNSSACALTNIPEVAR